MDKDELKKEKQKIEDIYNEQEKKFAKLDEQTEMFHNWINQTKESLFSIQKNWQSEESKIYFSKIEEEISYLQNKNLKLAEENEEERLMTKEKHLNNLDEIEKKINEEVEVRQEEEQDASI
ncbi:hypothetical protein [Breznakia pachnodae]|jgi:hypothetical protein|uniref:Nucleic acid-binding Zn-ribbon protein n=1 Tax=Breznakia pachnodae TaxID=265178 RepID=A0ABU0E2C8_9FIRM|nr:hypothetical protein [Breznakia pachnodae]MDQ0360876.1 putative nucleic acid-binding Zn-ribbon protein [Breznakia pachnodae]